MAEHLAQFDRAIISSKKGIESMSEPKPKQDVRCSNTVNDIGNQLLANLTQQSDSTLPVSDSFPKDFSASGNGKGGGGSGGGGGNAAIEP